MPSPTERLVNLLLLLNTPTLVYIPYGKRPMKWIAWKPKLRPAFCLEKKKVKTCCTVFIIQSRRESAKNPNTIPLPEPHATNASYQSHSHAMLSHAHAHSRNKCKLQSSPNLSPTIHAKLVTPEPDITYPSPHSTVSDDSSPSVPSLDLLFS